MITEWLTQFSGTHWQGEGELWLDAEGNSAETYACKMQLYNDGVNYSWYFKDALKTGSFKFNAEGAIWHDSWHQENAVQCAYEAGAWGIFTLSHAYKVPENPDWGWRSKLSQRPDGCLVLQMTNIAPWGEEGRAVRMIFSKVES